MGLRYVNLTAEDEDSGSDIDEAQPSDSDITELKQLDAVTSSSLEEVVTYSHMTYGEGIVLLLSVLVFLLYKLKESCCKDACSIRYKEPIESTEMKNMS